MSLKYEPYSGPQVRVYANSAEVEVEWTVGSIPIEDCLGKEVFSIAILVGAGVLLLKSGWICTIDLDCQLENSP